MVRERDQDNFSIMSQAYTVLTFSSLLQTEENFTDNHCEKYWHANFYILFSCRLKIPRITHCKTQKSYSRSTNPKNTTFILPAKTNLRREEFNNDVTKGFTTISCVSKFRCLSPLSILSHLYGPFILYLLTAKIIAAIGQWCISKTVHTHFFCWHKT